MPIFRGQRGGHRGGKNRRQKFGSLLPTKTKQTERKSLVCEICDANERKYRCPNCHLHYCSLQCFKDHKPKCIDNVAIEDEDYDVRDSSLLAEHERRMAVKRGRAHHEGEIELTDSSSEDDEEVEGPDDPDRLLRMSLKSLESDKLKQLLTNPHLRNLVLELDGAEDKNANLHLAMQEPLFLELADACLEVVEADVK